MGGTTSASNSLAYGFAPSASTAIGDITWNVVIAKNISQTAGDYFDITLPDRTAYPNLFMSFILLNSAWDSRTIVSGNICSITNVSTPNFCITDSQSQYDANEAHFIICQGTNTFNGIYSRVTIATEDWHMSTTDKDYNDFTFSLCSRTFASGCMNDTNVA